MIEYVLAAAAIIWFIRFVWNRNNAFANSDLKGPQGYPVIGNLLDISKFAACFEHGVYCVSNTTVNH